MKNAVIIVLLVILAVLSQRCNDNQEKLHYPDNMYTYSDDLESRWISFENIAGEKGKGGMENYGAKGHPSDRINAGERKIIFQTDGPGIINRIWITISDRSPEALRGLVINIHWDDSEKPAVSVPFGDFFGIGLGMTTRFENALFANPERRSFNSYLHMPFKKAARIEIVNEMDVDLYNIFYDVNYQLLNKWDNDFLYFHAYWHRDTTTILAEDFRILPEVVGKGRFLGTNISVVANPIYEDSWWGEGEVKIYLNNDDKYPTLVGTGTEDYIGTAWGQGEFINTYQGCPIADEENKQWAFYRYHIPDPVYFSDNCKVTIQQMGGTTKENVLDMQAKGVDLIPVTISGEQLMHIYYPDSLVDLTHPDLPGMQAWTNFYRSDDVAAVAYFYLDKPDNNLPALQDYDIRTWKLN